MRVFSKIKTDIFITAIIAVIMCGCSTNSTTNTTQREYIVEYLETEHDPLLISESEVSSSFDLNPQFYTIYPSYTYRYISTYYNDGREAMLEVNSSSQITISFDIYEFTGSEISDSDLPVYTNRASDEQRLIDAGLNTAIWDFTPKTFKIGSNTLLSSIEEALIGCREGDDVELYLTFNVGYGDVTIGAIEKESALRFTCTIDSVEN